MMDKIKKLTNNFTFIISVVTLVLLLIDNRDEVKQCVKELLQKDSWIKFSNDIKSTFSSYTDKAKRIYKHAIEILGE